MYRLWTRPQICWQLGQVAVDAVVRTVTLSASDSRTTAAIWSSASWGNAPSGSSMPTPPTYVLSGRGWSIAGEQNRASANVRKSPVYIGVDTVRDAPLRCVVSLHHLGPARPCPARSHPPERPPGPPAGRERGGAFSNRNGIPLTVPDVRRLLRLLDEPEASPRPVWLHLA